MGNGAVCGICHSFTSDGRCVSLLKLLLTNACIYDCAYCVNRRTNDTLRVLLTPREVAELTIGFYRRNYIEGLFLSSGVVKNPDYTMELLITAARHLRIEHRFNGYVHLKLVPGADPLLVEEAGRLADRVSMNLELPTDAGLKLLAPDKSRESLLDPMRRVATLITATRAERRLTRKVPAFAPAGQSTQLIVGASNETDRQMILLSENLYRRLDLKRVYYSAFVPVGTSRLPLPAKPPLLREHRLYQADWLLRYYGFTATELLGPESPNLDVELDPKCAWALRHIHLFPLEVNRADYEQLLRVPGIGVRSAHRIVTARRLGHLSLDDLTRLGVVMKRAGFFVTARGKYRGGVALEPGTLRGRLMAGGRERKGSEQLSLFAPRSPDFVSAVTGEL